MPMTPPCTKPFCWVIASRNGNVTSTCPAETAASEAPMSAMACWRPKLARMRASKPGSAGCQRKEGGAVIGARLLDVYVNVNRARSGLQSLAHLALEGADLGELRLQVCA